MKSSAPIAFDYRPSRTVLVALGVVALAAAAAPWASAAPPALRVALSALALSIAIVAGYRHCTPRHRRIAHGATGWLLVDADGREHPAALTAHRRLGALVVLGFRAGPRERFRAILLPDNLDRETHRRLVLVLARGEPAAADGIA